MKAERQSNIELLRILAIMGVVILHYNNPLIGGGIGYAQNAESANLYVLYVLESLFACAVDLFMIISGYFMCQGKKHSLWKTVELIVQVMVFSVLTYVVRTLLHHESLSIKSLLISLLPKNYFVILYCGVYILSPFINKLIDQLSPKGLRKLTFILILLFAVYPTVVDVLSEVTGKEFVGLSSIGMYGSQWGYTIVNFLMMYIIGAWLRKGEVHTQSWGAGKLVTALLGCVAMLTLWTLVNDRTGYKTERSAWEYCNPVLIIEAVVILRLFLKVDIGARPVINRLAGGAFTVFLLHGVFIGHLGIERYVTGNVLIMLLHMLGSAIGIYLVCWCVYFVYNLVSKRAFAALSKRIHLPEIDAEA